MCTGAPIVASKLWLCFGSLWSVHLHVWSWHAPAAPWVGCGFLLVPAEMHEANHGCTEALQSYAWRDLCLWMASCFGERESCLLLGWAGCFNHMWGLFSSTLPWRWSFFHYDGLVMIFLRIPLLSMVFQWFYPTWTITIECFFRDEPLTSMVFQWFS